MTDNSKSDILKETGSIWNELKPFIYDEYWGFEFALKIQQNLSYIKDSLLYNFNVVVENFVDIDYSDYLAPNVLTAKTRLNQLEGNIDSIKNTLDCFMRSYGQSVSYSMVSPFLDDLNRWIAFCEEARKIADKENRKRYVMRSDGKLMRYKGALMLMGGYYELRINGQIMRYNNKIMAMGASLK